jgi:ribonuclease G
MRVGAVSSELLINVMPGQTRIALVEQGLVQEIYIERHGIKNLAGNIYRGRVVRVLPGMSK